MDIISAIATALASGAIGGLAKAGSAAAQNLIEFLRSKFSLGSSDKPAQEVKEHIAKVASQEPNTMVTLKELWGPVSVELQQNRVHATNVVSNSTVEKLIQTESISGDVHM